ncbi:MAG: rRNA maturation RNase YbeY [Deltaproteobacteria bacterium]|nr:rRNA maturation RNase YbeY [Deltaproteobacteria bacterium]
MVLKDSELSEAELSVLLTNDAELCELNKRFRGIDKATDVLSFPMDDPVLLGDIAISLDRASAQALDYDATFEEEVVRLLIHGTLHLLGYDHVNGGRQAAKMRKKEESFLSIYKKNNPN